MNNEQRGRLVIVAGAALWGIFWYPLRILEQSGAGTMGAIFLVSMAAVVPAVVLVFQQNEWRHLSRPATLLAGVLIGLSLVLYFVGIIVADVIRVIMLFYLLPVWATLLSRIFFGQAITLTKMSVIGVALLGLWLLLSNGNFTVFPVPGSLGDWCGLIAGIAWAGCLTVLRHQRESAPYAANLIALSFACLLTLLAMQFPQFDGLSVSDTQARTWLLALLFGLLVLYPSMLGQIWGAQHVPAPTAALLTMSEIIAATFSALLLAGTSLTWTGWLGAALIILSASLDVTLEERQRKRAAG